jgi:hypothetical protein
MVLFNKLTFALGALILTNGIEGNLTLELMNILCAIVMFARVLIVAVITV